MKCNCSKRDLQNAIFAVSKALPSKAPTPVLTGIYINAENDTLEIQTTDFSLGMIVKIPAEIEIEGATVIPGKFAAEIVSKLPGEIVSISEEEDSHIVVLKSLFRQFELYAMNPEEFPRVSVHEVKNSFTIQNDILKRLIQCSTFACAGVQETRPIFRGCSLSVENSNITVVATNTHRLVVVKAEIEDEVSEEIKCIVPSVTLNSLIGIINMVDNDNGVKIDISDRQISFTINNYFVTCRLIDGNFPPHDKVIPASSETFAFIEVKKLREAISGIGTVAKLTEYHTVHMAFKNEGIDISADSYDLGKATDHIDARIEGPDANISFNIDYIQDFLRIFGDGELKIGINDPLSPAVFSFEENEDFIYIVTPIRTQ